MKEYVTLPTNLKATGASLNTLYSYLYKLAEQINVALSNIDAGEISAEGLTTLAGAVTQPVVDNTAAKISEVRALIIKEATEVQSQYDELRETLTAEYLAKSEFGDIRAEITNEITESAEGVIQSLNYTETISNINDALDVVNEYVGSTSGYIKTGIIEYDADTHLPIYGIAIGQNVEVNEDGEIVKEGAFLSTHTAREIAFWQNGIKIAYIVDGQMYMPEVTITGKLTFGNWELNVNNGLTLKWIGG